MKSQTTTTVAAASAPAPAKQISPVPERFRSTTEPGRSAVPSDFRSITRPDQQFAKKPKSSSIASID